MGFIFNTANRLGLPRHNSFAMRPQILHVYTRTPDNRVKFTAYVNGQAPRGRVRRITPQR